MTNLLGIIYAIYFIIGAFAVKVKAENIKSAYSCSANLHYIIHIYVNIEIHFHLWNIFHCRIPFNVINVINV